MMMKIFKRHTPKKGNRQKNKNLLYHFPVSYLRQRSEALVFACFWSYPVDFLCPVVFYRTVVFLPNAEAGL
jgi:hypothetical protein